MRALLDVVFPPRCVSCARGGARWLCADCVRWCARVERWCARCGRPDSTTGCRDCARLRPTFAWARAPFLYEGPARDALLAFKLRGERQAARSMARAMLWILDGACADAITFVPSTRRTRAQRGFDPAEELARAVARETGLAVRPLLRKLVETPDQASLGPAARRANLTGAFRSLRAAGTLLLVDDVMTTGTTAQRCSTELLRAGASEVGVLTFARAR